MKIKSFFIFTSLIGLSLWAPNAYADFCKGGILTIGLSKAEVLLKCGQPTFKSTDQVIHQAQGPHSGYHGIYLPVSIEEWTYDLGPTRFIRILTFKNGKLTEIRNGFYGRGGINGVPSPSHSNSLIKVGDSKYEVLLKYGRPTFQDSHQEVSFVHSPSHKNIRVVHTVEEWTYNFGPHRFLRVITLVKGRVTNIRTGGYGQ